MKSNACGMKNRVSDEGILVIVDDIILRRQHECEDSDELHDVFCA